MNEDDKVRVVNIEQRVVPQDEPVKMTSDEIKAELIARLDSELESYISESLRYQRLTERSS